MTDGKILITIDDAKNFLDLYIADVEMLCFLASKTNLESKFFYFDEELNAIVFADEVTFSENELIKNLPNIMEEKLFEETVTNLALKKKFG